MGTFIFGKKKKIDQLEVPVMTPKFESITGICWPGENKSLSADGAQGRQSIFQALRISLTCTNEIPMVICYRSSAGQINPWKPQMQDF